MIDVVEEADGFTSDPSQVSRMPTKTELVEAGLLKDRQAEAYMHRVLEGVSREETARLMGITPSTVDDHLRVAQQKIERANETLALIEGVAPEEIEPVTQEPDESGEEVEA